MLAKVPFKIALIAGCAFGAIAPNLALAQSQTGEPSQATAPQATAAETNGLQEIIVTAQRRSENVQKTPIAITAFTADSLQNLGIVNVNDLAKQTPAFTVRRDITVGSAPLFSIRGLSQNQIYLQFQPSIAVYEDGVYAATSTGSVFSGGLLDVERVEVLKGPQGTLFGRNSTGGAVSVVTRMPTGEFGGEIRGTAGSNGLMGVSGVLNLPIAGEDVGLRIVGQYRDTTGYGQDLTSGRDLNDENVRAVRATFRARSGPFQLIVRAEYSKSDTGPSSLINPVVTPASTAVFAAAFELGLARSPADLANPAILAAARQGFLDLRAPGRYDMRFAAGVIPQASAETYGGSVTASYDVTDEIQIKSITGLRKNNIFSINDSDTTPIRTIATTPGFTQHLEQFTQELQLNGSALDERLKFATGAYYYKLTGFDKLHTEALPVLNPTSPSFFFGESRDISKAAYAQATFEIVKGLNATGGIRYTDEDITFRNHNAVTNGATGLPSICVVPVALRDPGAPCTGTFKNGFTNWSYTAGLDYQASPDLLVYGKVARGFKAGGQNQNGQNAVAAFGSFKPELATTYELGLKSQLLDRRLRANIAVYQTDFTDIQRTIYVLSGGSTATARVENAASARIRGGEFELTVAPTDRVDLNVGAAYTDAKYQNYTVVDPRTLLPIDRSADRFPGVPDWQLNFAAAYTAPLPFGSLRFGVDGSYQSAVIFDPANKTAISQGATTQSGYTIVNGRLTLKIDDQGFEATAFVTNIFDKQYITGGADLTTLLGFAFENPGAPRMWGVELTKRF